MKKVLIAFSAVALLASCGGAEDKAAAAAFCECYQLQADMTAKAAESTSTADLFSSMDGMEELQTCVKTFQTTFEGKISEDGFKSELKESCPDALAFAEKSGMFAAAE